MKFLTDETLSRSVVMTLVLGLLTQSKVEAQSYGVRTFTFNNYCSFPVWPAIAGGGGSARNGGQCNVDGDCWVGQSCITTGAIKQCFWNNPTPTNGNYELQPGQSNTFNFPVNNIVNNQVQNSVVWSGVIGGRTGCVNGNCQTANCGVGDGSLNCKPGSGLNQPASQAEFTLASTGVDFYDMTIINGWNLPIEFKALASTPTPTNTNPAYWCGNPGGSNPKAPGQPKATWNFQAPTPDYVYVSSGGPTGCNSNADCQNGLVCGLAFTPGVGLQRSCGTQLGYWSADQICGVQNSFTGSDLQCSTLFPLYACAGVPSGYQPSSAGNPNVCGCANWWQVGVPEVPSTTGVCVSTNPTWVSQVQPKLLWMKQGCPSCYTYPYDDFSSTYTCAANDKNNINLVNYEINFCPQNAGTSGAGTNPPPPTAPPTTPPIVTNPDSLIASSVPTNALSTGSFTVPVTYVANGNRVLVADVLLPSANYAKFGTGYITVSAGSASTSIPVTMSGNPAPGNTYLLNLYEVDAAIFQNGNNPNAWQSASSTKGYPNFVIGATPAPTPAPTLPPVVVTTNSPNTGASTGTDNYNPGAGWVLDFADEFNGPNIDTSIWNYELGNNNGWGNNELETYTNSPANSFIQNGALVISAIKTTGGVGGYTSARLTTQNKKTFLYGKIAARIKSPQGKGIWGAFWALGINIPTVGWPACGEIDIFEMVGGGCGFDDTEHFSTHWKGTNGAEADYTQSIKTGSCPPNYLSSSYRVYEAEWNAQTLIGRMDGVQFFQMNIGSDPNVIAYTKPMFLLLNLAVGGNFPGSPDASTIFPANMYVDWVRHYTYNPNPPTTIAPPVTAAPATSGPVTVQGYTAQANTDYPYNDLGYMALTSGASQCATYCNANPSCTLFVIDSAATQCWIKQAAANKATTTNRVAYTRNSVPNAVPNYSLESSTDHSGNDITSLVVADANGCGTACNGQAGCVAFVTNGAANYCWLKSALGSGSINSDRNTYTKQNLGDFIYSLQGPMNIGNKGSTGVQISYSAAAPRQITVDLLRTSDYSKYGTGTIQVPAGSNTISLGLTICYAGSCPPAGTNYIFNVWSVDVPTYNNGQNPNAWKSALVTKSIATSVVAVAGFTPYVPEISISGYVDLSCNYDYQRPRMLPNYLGWSFDMTPALCMVKARQQGYLLAAIEYGGECWAGNNFTSALTPSTSCSIACTGNPSFTCGGIWSSNYYDISQINSTLISNLFNDTLNTLDTTVQSSYSSYPNSQQPVSTTPAITPDNGTNDMTTTYIIIGACIGGAFVLLTLVGLIYCQVKKSNQSKTEKEMAMRSAGV